MANQAKEFYDDYKAFFGDGTSPETEQSLTELQEALQALQTYVDTLPTEDTDTVFDPTTLNEAIAALQQGLQDNGSADETNITNLQTTLQALQDYVNTLPTEDTDTIFDPTPLNESISILQTSLQQFREQMEIAQAQQAAALAENTQIDSEQQQDIDDLLSRVTTLENTPDQTKVIGYQDATAQEIIAFYEQNPHAALIVDNNGEQHTTLFFLKQSDSKCLIRHLGTINGVWHVFQHTIDNARWTSTVFPIQDKLESGTSIKTINGESLLGSGDITIAPPPNFEVVTKKVPQFKVYSITLDDVVVPANGRLNTTALPIEQLTVQIEEGYKIRSYKSLMILKGTHASTGITDPDEKAKANNAWRKVFLQSFSTGGGETIPNVSVYNANDYDATVMLIMDFNTVKEEEITFLVPVQTPTDPTDPTNGDDNG